MKTSGTIFFFLQRHSYAIVKLPESSLVLSMKINIDDIASRNSGQRKGDGIGYNKDLYYNWYEANKGFKIELPLYWAELNSIIILLEQNFDMFSRHT